jgi:hypothetical protein
MLLGAALAMLSAAGALFIPHNREHRRNQKA